LIVFFSEGTASVADSGFCFLAEVEGNLSSGFLFFSISAIACSNRKLRSAVSVGAVPGSCTLGLCSTGGGWAEEDGLLAVLSLMGVMLARSGGGPNLSVTRVCVKCAEEEPSLGGSTSVSTHCVVSVACSVVYQIDLPPSAPPGIAPAVWLACI
jgi:hypothetical protein